MNLVVIGHVDAGKSTGTWHVVSSAPSVSFPAWSSHPPRHIGGNRPRHLFCGRGCLLNCGDVETNPGPPKVSAGRPTPKTDSRQSTRPWSAAASSSAPAGGPRRQDELEALRCAVGLVVLQPLPADGAPPAPVTAEGFLTLLLHQSEHQADFVKLGEQWLSLVKQAWDAAGARIRCPLGDRCVSLEFRTSGTLEDHCVRKHGVTLGALPTPPGMCWLAAAAAVIAAIIRFGGPTGATRLQRLRLPPSFSRALMARDFTLALEGGTLPSGPAPLSAMLRLLSVFLPFRVGGREVQPVDDSASVCSTGVRLAGDLEDTPFAEIYGGSVTGKELPLLLNAVPGAKRRLQYIPLDMDLTSAPELATGGPMCVICFVQVTSNPDPGAPPHVTVWRRFDGRWRKDDDGRILPSPPTFPMRIMGVAIAPHILDLDAVDLGAPEVLVRWSTFAESCRIIGFAAADRGSLLSWRATRIP